MELEQAIRTRRTHKAFAADPLAPEVLRELFELARWAPNHHLTNPWRFRVLGAQTLQRLKLVAEAAKPGSAVKLERAPTLVVVSVWRAGDETQQADDLLAAGVAAYVILLAAHGRGLAGYWRTLSVLDTPQGRAAVGLDDQETPVGLLHLGWPRQQQRVPERAPVDSVASFLP
jgi:nitroreductase